MFNKSVLLTLITLSLCAIYTSAAPKKIAGRQASSSHDLSDSDSEFDYETFDFNDRRYESPEMTLLDDQDSQLAREVAEADYVPPPKYAYVTGNGEMSQKTIGNSNVNDAKHIEDDTLSSEKQKLERDANDALMRFDVDDITAFLDYYGNSNDRKTVENSQIDVDDEGVEEPKENLVQYTFSDEQDTNESAEQERLARELADLEAQIIPNSKAASDQSERNEESYWFDANEANAAEQRLIDLY